jgi:hypothetical protein
LTRGRGVVQLSESWSLNHSVYPPTQQHANDPPQQFEFFLDVFFQRKNTQHKKHDVFEQWVQLFYWTTDDDPSSKFLSKVRKSENGETVSINHCHYLKYIFLYSYLKKNMSFFRPYREIFSVWIVWSRPMLSLPIELMYQQGIS